MSGTIFERVDLDTEAVANRWMKPDEPVVARGHDG